jgi:hypothetical protein
VQARARWGYGSKAALLGALASLAITVGDAQAAQGAGGGLDPSFAQRAWTDVPITNRQLIPNPATGGYVIWADHPGIFCQCGYHQVGPDGVGNTFGWFSNGNDGPAKAVLLDDGSIVIARAGAVEGKIVVAKAQPDGLPDTTFDGSAASFGLVNSGLAADPDAIAGLTLAPNGDVVIAATTCDDAICDAVTGRSVRVARIRPDGSQAPGFGDADGTIEYHANGIAGGDVEVTNQHIYLAARNGFPAAEQTVVVSYDAATGVRDIAFDGDGIFSVPFAAPGRNRPVDLAVRSGLTPELYLLGANTTSGLENLQLARIDGVTAAMLQMGPGTAPLPLPSTTPAGALTVGSNGDVYFAYTRDAAGGGSEVFVDSALPGGPDPLAKTYGAAGGVATGCTASAGQPAARAEGILHSAVGDRVAIVAMCNGNTAGTYLRRVTGRTLIGDGAAVAPTGTIGPGGRLVKLDDLPLTDPLGADTGVMLQSSPYRSSPLSSPYRSSPYRSSPYRSSPYRSSPLSSSALPPLLLSEIPLVSTTWDEVLKGTTLEGAPLNTVTLQQVFALDPPPPLLATLTLDEIDLTRTPLADLPLAAVLLGQIPLNALPAPAGGWCAVLGNPNPCAIDTDSDTLVSLGLKGFDLSAYLAKPLPFSGPGIDLTQSTLFTFALVDMDMRATPIGALPASKLGALLGCFPECPGTVADAQAADPTHFSDASLGELVREGVPELANLTVGDILAGLLPPVDLPFEQAPIEDLLASAPSSAASVVDFAHDINLDCSLADDLRIEFKLPTGATFVRDGSSIRFGAQVHALVDDPDSSDERAVFERTTTQTLNDLCDDADAANTDPSGQVTLRVTVPAELPARIGPTGAGELTVSTRYASSAEPNASIDVQDTPDAGSDLATAASLGGDELRTGYIADATDVDSYKIAAPPVGSTVTVELSNLPADYDLAVTGEPVDGDVAPYRSSPYRSSPYRSSAFGLLDDGAAALQDTETAPPEGVQELPLDSSALTASPYRSSSLNRGLSAESASFVVTEVDAGKDFLVQVYGYNGASSRAPYLVRYEVTPPTPAPSCVAARTLPTASKGAWQRPGANTKTLILVNEQRLAQLYPNADLAALRTALAAYAARPEVAGAVLAVESDPNHGTAAAYAEWDAHPCSVAAANGVVDAINAVVDGAADGLPQLRNIMLVGGDTVLPHRRVADLVSLANETTYADSLVFGGHETPQSAAARRGMVFSDDAYGDFDPQTWTAGNLYVPDVGLGRLVETPAEIVGQLAQYAASSGRLNPTSAFVAGYDFLTDGGGAVADGLGTRFGGTAPATRLDETWPARIVRDELTRPDATATSINAHYDHYRALPAAAFNDLGIPDLLRAGSVSPAAGSILFTMGCHAGLSVVDAGAPAATTEESLRLLDWPQVFAQRAAVYVANSGYGYGDSEAIAFSERLMALYAQQLGQARATAAQALMFAKQQYFTEPTPLGVYDAKSLQQAIFYGPPTYRIGSTGTEGAVALPDDPAPGGARASTPVSTSPAFVEHSTDRGRYWTVGGEPPQASHYRPLQPRLQRDVTSGDPSSRAHGVLVEGLAMDVISDVDPVSVQPTFDHSDNEPEADTRAGVFPHSLARVERVATADGKRDVLTLVAGQFDAGPDGTGSQRLFKRVDTTVYRSGLADWDPPVADLVRGEVAGGEARFHVHTADTDVTRVVVLYADESGTWRRLDLSAAGGGDYLGAAPFDDAKVPSYFVQLVDTAGNVGITAAHVANTGLATPTAPHLDVTPARPASGWHTGPAKVALDPGASSGTFQVTIDQGAPFTYSAPFTVSGDGDHTVIAVGSDGTRLVTGIHIDATAPVVTGTISGATRSPEGWYGTAPLTVGWQCSDATSGVESCPQPTTIATQGAGQTFTSGPGSDRAGNSATGTVTVNVDLTDPTSAISPTNGKITLRALTGTAADALSGIRSVRVTVTKLSGKPMQPLSGDAVLTCDAARRSCTWSLSVKLAGGAYRGTSLATDRAGRVQPVGAARDFVVPG